MSITQTTARPSSRNPRMERTSEPGVFRRGGRYVYCFRDPITGKQRRIYAKTFNEARDLKATTRADIRRGDYRRDDVDAEVVTFRQYAKEWGRTYGGRTSKGIRESTLADYVASLERDAIPFFGDRKLRSIGPRDVKRFVAHVQSRGVSHNTVRLALAPVRCLFGCALEDELIERNPCAGVRVTRPADAELDDDRKEKAKAMTEEELARVLAELAVGHRPLFELLAGTGLRIAEALALRWSDLDLGRRQLHVRRRYYRGSFAPPKTRSGRRTVPLSPGMAQTLWSLRKDAGAVGDDALVFTSSSGGALDAHNVRRRVLRPAAKAAGVPWVSGFHVFRHTFATLLFRHGANAKQAQVVLGHHSASFTLSVYTHLLPDDLPSVDFMDALVAMPKPSVAQDAAKVRAQVSF